MDRFVHSLVDSSREAGYHVLLFSGTRTGKAEDELPAYDDLLRSTAVDAFVVTDTYLGNPQAAWLNDRRAPFVAFGRPWNDPERPAPVGRRRRRGRRRHGHLAPDRARPHTGSRGSAGARTRCSARTAGPAGRGRCARATSRPPGWPRGSRTPWRRAARRAPCCSTRPSPTAFVCASDTLAMGVLHTLADRGLRPGQDIAVTGFDDSQVAQTVPPGLTSVRLPLEEVAVEVVKALEGLLGAPPTVSPGVLLTPTLRGARGSG